MAISASTDKDRPAGSSVGAAERFALPVLLFAAVAIAFSGIFVKLAETGPIATGVYRMALATPVFFLIIGLDRRPHATAARPASRRDFALLALAGALFAGDVATWNLALSTTSVANGTLLGNMAPIFVTLGAWLLFRERVTRTFLAGMAVALAGSAVLVGESFSLSAEQAFGDGLALTAALFYGGYILAVARLRARFSTVAVMAWSSAAGALVLLPIALIAGESFLAVTLTGWLMLLGLGFVSHAAGQGLIAYALAHLPASFGSVALLVQPAAAAVAAWLILDEALSWWQALGAAIILAGILVARKGSARNVRKAAPS